MTTPITILVKCRRKINASYESCVLLVWPEFLRLYNANRAFGNSKFYFKGKWPKSSACFFPDSQRMTGDAAGAVSEGTWFYG